MRIIEALIVTDAFYVVKQENDELFFNNFTS